MKLPGKLILASASPRRRELLAQAGFEFDVRVADIDETRRDGEHPSEYVRRLAYQKAHAISSVVPEAIVLGADTTVVLDGEVLNKPMDIDDAEWMLLRLSGRKHQVYTGLAVMRAGLSSMHLETTDVFFRTIEQEELQTYLASGDPLDKAGAYGIQGYAARWIPRIEGDYFNVVGLPISSVVRLLSEVR
jgi:septum formation protein